ncbi:MAG: 50S ribosomal protein L21 [Anaerolineaceae bacterium]|nr:50S ribosomal protein L21 [Anaerolineaceae bacterium]
MKYAIVENGGKQYKAIEGENIVVDLLPQEAGEEFTFDNVLLSVDGDDVVVGTPSVDGVKVKTTIVKHEKGPKIVIFKYRAKQRYRVKTGHRQQYTRLQIVSIDKE